MMKVVAGVVEALGALSRTRKDQVCQRETAIGVGRADEAALLLVAELIANSPYG